MSHQETEVYEEVQAALLNSSCHPRPATQMALKAAAEFAECESLCAMPIAVGADTDVEAELKKQFLRLASEAWDSRARL